jgi:hypothetical protein
MTQLLLRTYFVETGGVGFNGLDWYAGLIDGDGFTGVANTDTMASHGGWTENTDYDFGARIELSTPIGIDTPARAVSSIGIFTFTALTFVQGIFIADSVAWGATTGLLWCTMALDTALEIPLGSELFTSYALYAQPNV